MKERHKKATAIATTEHDKTTVPNEKLRICEVCSVNIIIGKYGSVSSRHCHLTVLQVIYRFTSFRIDTVRMT